MTALDHDVNRWHSNPHQALRNSGDTISAHQKRVRDLCESACRFIGKSFDDYFERAALNHDAAETVLGDMPAPAKYQYPDLAKLYEEKEREILNEMGLIWNLGEIESRILKLCDKLDAALWAIKCGVDGPEYETARKLLPWIAISVDPRLVDWLNQKIQQAYEARE